MSFFYNPDEIEDKEDIVLPVGHYDVEIESADRKTSKSGKQMIELSVKVFQNKHNFDFHVYEYLIEGTHWKVRQVLDSIKVDSLSKADIGNLCMSMLGKIGFVELVEDEYNGKKKNKIKRWLVKPGSDEIPTQYKEKEEDVFD